MVLTLVVARVFLVLEILEMLIDGEGGLLFVLYPPVQMDESPLPSELEPGHHFS
jgi:hypothetical protein